MIPLQTYYDAAAFLRKRIGGREPVVGIILGSGLGKLSDLIQDPVTVPYRDIPGFPVSTAIGHKGNFIIGKLGGKCVIAMQGRIHYYEGYPMGLTVLPVRVMVLLGIKALFVSNAAGGTDPDFRVGDLMLIRDPFPGYDASLRPPAHRPGRRKGRRPRHRAPQRRVPELHRPDL